MSRRNKRQRRRSKLHVERLERRQLLDAAGLEFFLDDLRAGDLDGDGDSDIINVSRNLGQIRWYEKLLSLRSPTAICLTDSNAPLPSVLENKCKLNRSCIRRS